jgi:hypothetical protein
MIDHIDKLVAVNGDDFPGWLLKEVYFVSREIILPAHHINVHLSINPSYCLVSVSDMDDACLAKGFDILPGEDWRIAAEKAFGLYNSIEYGATLAELKEKGMV